MRSGDLLHGLADLEDGVMSRNPLEGWGVKPEDEWMLEHHDGCGAEIRDLSQRLMETDRQFDALSTELAFLRRVLATFAMAPHDFNEDLIWRVDGKYAPITFWVNVSDVFDWASADMEEITPDSLDDFDQAVQDLRAIKANVAIYASALYAARRRQRRPMSEYYTYRLSPMPPEVAELFNAAGPPRKD
jgi:hypothetical protein